MRLEAHCQHVHNDNIAVVHDPTVSRTFFRCNKKIRAILVAQSGVFGHQRDQFFV